MVALLSGDSVDLPLLCGEDGLCYQAFPVLQIRSAFGFALAAAVFLPTSWDNLLTFRSFQRSCSVPFSVHQAQTASPSFSTCEVNVPGGHHQAQLLSSTPPSLITPGGQRSYPVSADGVLQERGHLLTVLLHIQTRK